MTRTFLGLTGITSAYPRRAIAKSHTESIILIHARYGGQSHD